MILKKSKYLKILKIGEKIHLYNSLLSGSLSEVNKDYLDFLNLFNRKKNHFRNQAKISNRK